MTPDVRRVTRDHREKELPAELETLLTGGVCCSSGSHIEVNLAPSGTGKPSDGVYVWSLGGQSAFGCGWTRVSFSLTTPEELARAHGPHPKGWVAGRSAGLPVPLTPTLAVIKNSVGHRTISLDVVEPQEIEDRFAAAALELASKILDRYVPEE